MQQLPQMKVVIRKEPRRRACHVHTLSAAGAQAMTVALVVNGFLKDVLQHLPMEFAIVAQKLISISLEGSVG